MVWLYFDFSQGGISELLAYDVIAIRYTTCALLLLPVWLLRERFNPFQPKLIVACLFGGVAYALFVFHGFQLAPASHAAVLLPGAFPLLIIVLSCVINGERFPWQKWLGIAVITGGVGALFWSNSTQNQGSSEGHLFLILGAMCWALFSVLIKRWHFTPWQLTISVAVITCVVYMPVYLLFLPKAISVSLWQDVLIQAFYQGFIATIVQMVWYVKAVQMIGPSSVGALMSIVPVLSGISAIFIFDESVTLALIVGLLLVSLGAWLAHSRFLKPSGVVIP